MIGAILLIAVGLVLLLNNLAVLDWGVWQTLSKLWPLLLIGIGFDLMLKKRRVAAVVVAVLLLGIVAGATALRHVRPVALVGMQVGVPTEGATLARVRLDAGVAALQVGSGPAGGPLLAGTIEHPEDAPPELRAELSGERMEVRLDQSDGDLGWLVGPGHGPEWRLQLAPDVPTDLRVEAGVGETQLDLRALTLSRLKVDCGVGQVRLELPGRGRYRAQVEGGVGRLEVLLPRGFPVRVEARTGLGAVSVSGDFQRDGERYISPGFEAASERLELEVEGGVGAIDIGLQAPEAPVPPLPAEAPLPPAPPAEAPPPPAPPAEAPLPPPAPAPATP
ncbi:MAG TPA: DUF5668 domain-containing protein [Myxococcota bacterium]|nr:DUF5668 domain-containing protein [Myxococcota bacterium]HRY95294.1 DUF5668 domain-containing protein [Myxococcota bacterium]HSA20881.1 DUF5668 domain-containing protein [Myxococcota bacterium]